ncbi:MAG: metal-dependent hydrolase [Ardenticatenaceae bacterium]|nr:metal-dependent hydrolase [Ardenticatenaceae bacterium]
MSYSLTFHGHSTFSLDLNGTKVIVDPFLKGNSPVAVKSADEVEADYIWLTHGHGDHVADALPIAKRTGATVISNFEIVGWINSNGHDKTHPQHLGGGFQHPFGYLKMTPALHGSMLPDGSNGGMAGGFLLKGDKNIYIAGDTALFSDMALIGAHDIDLAILPIGDNFTMGPDDALLAVNYLKPKVVVPCHYNTFGYIMQDADAWAKRVDLETDAKPVVMEIEETIEV